VLVASPELSVGAFNALYLNPGPTFHCMSVKKMKNAYRILVQKPVVKVHLLRRRNKWDDNGMNFEELACENMDWAQLVQGMDQ
jgi:hypothetical protein